MEVIGEVISKRAKYIQLLIEISIISMLVNCYIELV